MFESIHGVIAKSIEGQESNWKNALSRKLLEKLDGREPNSETIALNFILQAEQYKRDAYVEILTPKGYLPKDYGAKVKKIMLARASKENPALVPLIKAAFSTFPEQIPGERFRKGEPMSGNIAVSGHISRYTLWLIDDNKNRLQTMVRLLVERRGKSSLVDVYSNPVEDAFNHETLEVNVEGTGPSKAARILALAKQGYDVRGCIAIGEVDEHTVPQY